MRLASTVYDWIQASCSCRCNTEETKDVLQAETLDATSDHYEVQDEDGIEFESSSFDLGSPQKGVDVVLQMDDDETWRVPRIKGPKNSSLSRHAPNEDIEEDEGPSLPSPRRSRLSISSLTQRMGYSRQRADSEDDSRSQLRPTDSPSPTSHSSSSKIPSEGPRSPQNGTRHKNNFGFAAGEALQREEAFSPSVKPRFLRSDAISLSGSRINTLEKQNIKGCFRCTLDTTSGEGLGLGLLTSDGEAFQIVFVHKIGAASQYNSDGEGQPLREGQRIIDVNGVREDAVKMFQMLARQGILELIVHDRLLEQTERRDRLGGKKWSKMGSGFVVAQSGSKDKEALTSPLH
mmetsp:Transcript_11286/g.25700  ORF Transcript_11286/g.25700 Transcript_11286/m.25700 type:complete len:347 (+) Transcript_11286:93-1133(+)